MLIEKRVVIYPGTRPSNIYLCICALNKYLAEPKGEVRYKERTYTTDKGRQEIYIRESEKAYSIRYTEFPYGKKKWRKEKELVSKC